MLFSFISLHLEMPKNEVYPVGNQSSNQDSSQKRGPWKTSVAVQAHLERLTSPDRVIFWPVACGILYVAGLDG
jgi:hypothetical protein